jgi:hypothetical protein
MYRHQRKLIHIKPHSGGNTNRGSEHLAKTMPGVAGVSLRAFLLPKEKGALPFQTMRKSIAGTRFTVREATMAGRFGTKHERNTNYVRPHNW